MIRNFLEIMKYRHSLLAKGTLYYIAADGDHAAGGNDDYYAADGDHYDYAVDGDHYDYAADGDYAGDLRQLPCSKSHPYFDLTKL